MFLLKKNRGLRLWRYVYSERQGMSEIFDMPSSALIAFYNSVHSRVKETSWAQVTIIMTPLYIYIYLCLNVFESENFKKGIGRHSREDVINFMKKDLEIASNILGSNKFLLGDEPSIDDCSLFGFLVQILNCAPGSPYESFVQSKCKSYFLYSHFYWVVIAV